MGGPFSVSCLPLSERTAAAVCKPLFCTTKQESPCSSGRVTILHRSDKSLNQTTYIGFVQKAQQVVALCTHANMRATFKYLSDHAPTQ